MSKFEAGKTYTTRSMCDHDCIIRTTVYPSRAGGFPPASFFTFGDALGYIRTLQGYGLACGICTCPAASYPMHYRDTLPR